MQELPILTGRLVVLRPITDGDTDLIVAWRNTPSVMQNFIFREPFTPEMHRHWLATKVATGQVVQYIIEDKATGQAVGSVYYRDVDQANHSAEYGIFIGEPAARGKGSVPKPPAFSRSSDLKRWVCTASACVCWQKICRPAAVTRKPVLCWKGLSMTW